MSKAHKVTLTNGAASLLLNCLCNSQPGWKRDLKDAAHASRLIVETFGDFEPKPPADDAKEADVLAFKNWQAEAKEWAFSEKERDLIKFCITKLGSVLPTSKPAFELMTAFGLVED
jgi:hypothetical protein